MGAHVFITITVTIPQMCNYIIFLYPVIPIVNSDEEIVFAFTIHK